MLQEPWALSQQWMRSLQNQLFQRGAASPFMRRGHFSGVGRRWPAWPARSTVNSTPNKRAFLIVVEDLVTDPYSYFSWGYGHQSKPFQPFISLDCARRGGGIPGSGICCHSTNKSRCGDEEANKPKDSHCCLHIEAFSGKSSFRGGFGHRWNISREFHEACC